MWKWRDDTAKSPNVSLPTPGKLLRVIQKYPFDHNHVMDIGSYVLFLFSEKAALCGPPWHKDKNIDNELWLFHFFVGGEPVSLRWYEEVPIPPGKNNTGVVVVQFDWTNYWEYVSGESYEIQS